MIPVVDELRRRFRKASKRESHSRSASLLADLAEPTFLRAALQTYLGGPGSLSLRHYPVIGITVDSNPDFDLVVNCWLPLPGGESDISTKAIHHHGRMLLSTATIFGPGYEHWLYTPPVRRDEEGELFDLTLVEKQQHPKGHVSFVDAFVPHLPFYAPVLTITAALWSHHGPTTWKDRLKRIPAVQRNSAGLKGLARSLGLARTLDLKLIEYNDFYPTAAGYKGMKERTEFPRGPNQDYLASLFHVIQATGNDSLEPSLVAAIDREPAPEVRGRAEELLRRLRAGQSIEPRLSPGHYGVEFANIHKSAAEDAARRAMRAESLAREA